MKRVGCFADLIDLQAAMPEIGTLLYGSPSVAAPFGAIGGRVRDELARLDRPIDQSAFDFLSLALAVTVADRNVSRSDSDDGFGRRIHLTVSVANPNKFSTVSTDLERLLNFLSGDKWTLDFVGNGLSAPTKKERDRKRIRIKASEADEVCLFSGGLDSLVGAIDRFTIPNNTPLLVSRSSRGDKQAQTYLRQKIGARLSLSINDDPRSKGFPSEPSTRTRSLVFFALGACAASAISSEKNGKKIDLVVPENGFIAINPPLTKRRVGALSTRTVHPQFVSGLNDVFAKVGIPANIINPYYGSTKGEMLQNCSDPALVRSLSKHSVSCGKWKRYGQQCGRCLPCLIRRASFHAAGIPDDTVTGSHQGYRQADLNKVLKSHSDRADLFAVLAAINSVRRVGAARWTIRGGALPLDPVQRKMHVSAVKKGLDELEAFLASEGITV